MKPVLSALFNAVSGFGRASIHDSQTESGAESFDRHAAQWWDSQGPMAPLHKINPTRMDYVKKVLCRHFGRDVTQAQPLADLHILDIGCGGGLVCESLTRLGAKVTGIDSGSLLIDVARDHAAQQGLDIAYQAVLSDALVTRGLTFDVVLALEVIEHVAVPQDLLRDMAQLLKSDGVAVISTLNRTPASFMGGIVAAEYILRWVPRGTHQWHRFIKPHELAEQAMQAGLCATETMGLHYHVLDQTFHLDADKLDINYFMAFRHDA
jgi:2-polyprenyl-6-hydroxyphenyl methylase/3-demethylubiquinone-9 3-methyltransferase